jgi:ABC-2 type transport system ATP-binding protein
MALALRAEGLAKAYGRRRALCGVSLAVAPGERVAVLGPNGAGKTTLLGLLAGTLAPDGGRVEAPGAVGWVPQEPALYRRLTVAENLRLFARLEHVRDVEAAVDRMLEAAGLRERARDEAGALSGGGRQRLNLALGLLASPAVLLLDEPAASLDPRQRERLWTFLADRARQGTALVWSTHDLGEAERHADRLLVLDGGEPRFWGPPAALPGAHAAGLEAAFLALLDGPVA